MKLKNKIILLTSFSTIIFPIVVSSCSASEAPLNNIFVALKNSTTVPPIFKQGENTDIPNNDFEIKRIYLSGPAKTLELQKMYNNIPGLSEAVESKQITPEITFSLPALNEKDFLITINWKFEYNPNRPVNNIVHRYKVSELLEIKKLNILPWSSNADNVSIENYREALDKVLNKFLPDIQNYFKTIIVKKTEAIKDNGQITALNKENLNKEIFNGTEPNIFAYFKNPENLILLNPNQNVFFSTITENRDLIAIEKQAIFKNVE